MLFHCGLPRLIFHEFDVIDARIKVFPADEMCWCVLDSWTGALMAKGLARVEALAYAVQLEHAASVPSFPEVPRIDEQDIPEFARIYAKDWCDE